MQGVVGEPRDAGVPCGAGRCHARAASRGQRERVAVEGRVAAVGQGGDESRGEVSQLGQTRPVRGVADDKTLGGAARAPRARGQDRHLGAGGLVVGQGGDDDASAGARLLLDRAQGLVEGGDPLGVGGSGARGVDEGEVRVGGQGIGHRRRHRGGPGRGAPRRPRGQLRARADGLDRDILPERPDQGGAAGDRGGGAGAGSGRLDGARALTPTQGEPGVGRAGAVRRSAYGQVHRLAPPGEGQQAGSRRADAGRTGVLTSALAGGLFLQVGPGEIVRRQDDHRRRPRRRARRRGGISRRLGGRLGRRRCLGFRRHWSRGGEGRPHHRQNHADDHQQHEDVHDPAHQALLTSSRSHPTSLRGLAARKVSRWDDFDVVSAGRRASKLL